MMRKAGFAQASLTIGLGLQKPFLENDSKVLGR